MTRPGAITSANPDPSQQIWQLLSETWCTNLRSAMDNAAHYLAARHVQEAQGRDLTEDEEALTEFPIQKNGRALDAWLSASRGKGDSKVLRRQLYGSQEVKALRCVQPFALRE